MASIHEIFNGRLKKGDLVCFTLEKAQDMRRTKGIEVFPTRPVFFTGISYGNKKLYQFEIKEGDHIVVAPDEDLFQFPQE